MKKWFKNSPAFMRRLWCQLAISYAILAFCGMIILVVMLYGINDYNDFRAAITLEKVEEKLESEQIVLMHAINSPQNAEWLDKARNNVRDKLINMEEENNGIAIYRITNSSRPEVYIRITDRSDNILVSDPVDFPSDIANEFAVQSVAFDGKSRIRWLEEDGIIWVNMPIMDGSNGVIGHLRVLFIAKFDLWVQLKSIFDFLIYMLDDLIFLSVPIGIACGVVASRYVTKQLQKMNEVTESWRQGDFEPRIALPSDDVLIRHSQHLNDMAQDLEMNLGLKEDIAVSDERNRVARELHDTVKQKLFALGLQLAAAKAKPAEPDAAREHILEAEIITREAQHDLMEIITQLRPTGTGDASLYDRITMIADDFRRRFSVDIELNTPDSDQLNAYAEHHVLRIVQESLMNAVRHGKASKIVIESKIDNDTATLTIVDNGSGFDTDKKAAGFGLVSMRDRMRDLPRGTFEVKSASHTGTQITLSWKNEA